MRATIERRLTAIEQRFRPVKRYVGAVQEVIDGRDVVQGRDGDVTVTRGPGETDAAFQKRYRAALGVTDADVLVIRRIISPPGGRMIPIVTSAGRMVIVPRKAEAMA
jgi:hypothetical protein